MALFPPEDAAPMAEARVLAAEPLRWLTRRWVSKISHQCMKFSALKSSQEKLVQNLMPQQQTAARRWRPEQMEAVITPKVSQKLLMKAAWKLLTKVTQELPMKVGQT